jgi:hypothetical protein
MPSFVASASLRSCQSLRCSIQQSYSLPQPTTAYHQRAWLCLVVQLTPAPILSPAWALRLLVGLGTLLLIPEAQALPSQASMSHTIRYLISEVPSRGHSSGV